MQVSLVDDSPMELLYVTLGHLSVKVLQGANEEERSDGAISGATLRYQQQLLLELDSLQVDNQ